MDDKWVQGGSNVDSYGIWHWYLIDVFVYFSHDLVTLPPPSWVNAAHRHGVKVFGCFFMAFLFGWIERLILVHVWIFIFDGVLLIFVMVLKVCFFCGI